jgi:serine/threonine protein kinase/tetratricopeptide (TPR) repeat protein
MSTKNPDWTGHSLQGRNGQYRIKTALGSGGMATVYLAVDQRTGKEVAVKLPHEQILREEGFVARFMREVKSLLKLAHPNIVKVVDVGDFRGAPFAVLQYLALGSLRLQQPLDLADGKVWPMQPSEVVGWLRPVAEALDFVHSKGYVHRDVKPENIMFDADGNPYLGDFGVIKARADVSAGKPQTVATGAGLVLGTPHYMAPEVLMGEHYDGSADQYSLACTVYELLAARVPFPGEAPVAIVGHTTRPVPKLNTLVREMPPAIDQVVLRGLAKKKEDRYRDCRTFAAEFEAAVRANAPAQVAVPVPMAAPVRAGVAPPPVPNRPASRTPSAGQPSSRRTSPIVCPYCRYEVNLPDHVRSKAIRCAGCRKVYLLDAPSPNADTAKQEQARVDTRPDERRLPPPVSRTPRPRQAESRENEPIIDRKRPEAPQRVKPKGPPLWQRPGFRRFMRFSGKLMLVVCLLGAGGFGIYQGFLWYQARSARETAKLSDRAIDEGRYTEAVKYADSAIEKDSQCATAFVARGRAKYFQGDHEGALEDLNKAITLDPNQTATAQAYRSAVQSSRGLIDEALADAKAATAADPNLGVAYAYLGLAKLESGAADAELNCEQAFQKSPENPEVFRIRALVRMAKGRTQQAESDINMAVSKSGETAFYLASRGLFGVLPSGANQFDESNLVRSGGNIVRARADGDKAIKQDPACGLGHLSLAMAHIRSNDSSSALKSAESAIGASPRMVAAYEVAHWIAFSRIGDRKIGLEFLDRGIQAAPTSPRLHKLRGKARKDQADLKGAIEDFTELIRQAPFEPEGYRLRAGCYSSKGDSDLAAADNHQADQLQKDRLGAKK